jgi:hypothetical protein
MFLIFIFLLFLGPRFATFVWWLLAPARFNLAFHSTIMALFGIVFLPWTTLMYVIVSPGGITGFDWLWIGIAFFADVSSYAGGAYKGKKQMSSTTTTSTPPSTTTE